MASSTRLIVASLLASAASSASAHAIHAYHGAVDYSSFEWQPPAEGASRGPCPILNTMANHGFLPRSGRNISTADVEAGLLAGLNVADDISRMASANAIGLNPAENATTFDLEMLSAHNVIEHDNSLSRADDYWGDNHSFNQSVFDQVKDVWTGKETISLETAAKALEMRMRRSKEENPEFKLDVFGSTTTTASYIAVMGDKEKGEAVRAWTEYLFENERLPLELGWSPRYPAYSMDWLMSMSDRVEALLPADLVNNTDSSSSSSSSSTATSSDASVPDREAQRPITNNIHVDRMVFVELK